MEDRQGLPTVSTTRTKKRSVSSDFSSCHEKGSHCVLLRRQYLRGFVQLQFAIEQAVTAWKTQNMSGNLPTNLIPVTLRVR